MKTSRCLPHITRLAVMLAGLLVTAPCMAANADNRFSPENQANELIELWRNTCLKYFRDPAALRGAARKAGYLENPPNGASMLRGESGIVWDTSSSVYSQRALISADSGLCEIHAQIASSAVVQREFANGIEALASEDIAVKQMSDQKITEAFIGQRQQTYAVVDKTTKKAWVFGAGTSDSALSKTQAILTVLETDVNGKTQVISTNTMAKVLAEREALFDAREIDVPQFSTDIGAAVRESMQLEQHGKRQEALDRLLQLEKYAPLSEVPSAMAQLLASVLYMKLGKADLATRHQDLGTAYAGVLAQRIGKGDSPDDPIHVVMVNEMTDWVQTHHAQVVATRSMVAQGRELTVVTYSGRFTNNQPRDLYAEIDPRTRAQIK